jgi:lysozyme family protein
MSNAARDAAISKVIQREGGYVVDQGGPTNWGITLPFYKDLTGKTLTAEQLKALPVAEAQKIYALYFDRVGLSGLDNVELADLLFDFCVNSGESRAIKELQEIAGSVPDGKLGPATLAAVKAKGERTVYYALLQRRFRFWAGLARANPQRYGDDLAGWVNRGSTFVKDI